MVLVDEVTDENDTYTEIITPVTNNQDEEEDCIGCCFRIQRNNRQTSQRSTSGCIRKLCSWRHQRVHPANGSGTEETPGSHERLPSTAGGIEAPSGCTMPADDATNNNGMALERPTPVTNNRGEEEEDCIGCCFRIQRNNRQSHKDPPLAASEIMLLAHQRCTLMVGTGVIGWSLEICTAYGNRRQPESHSDGPCSRSELCFLYLGLCPEVPFGSDSEASCKEPATHIPAFCTHSLPSAKSPDKPPLEQSQINLNEDQRSFSSLKPFVITIRYCRDQQAEEPLGLLHIQQQQW
ncbi:uncharacterized protein LOC110260108 [Sus scrofa]|uniref:uncharacterized protein LOC110260108 n=1 Tax=Sus scrofa TaxID=9823 RepID=UPI000A2AF708|nr:uncharacterized protein LOC110260108 [Sus scrofa]